MSAALLVARSVGRVTRGPGLGVLAVALASATCGPPSAAEYGASVAENPRYSASLYNAYACTTCHPIARNESADAPLLTGAPLEGALSRPSFWGGAVRTFDDAVDQCFRRFMRGGPLDRTSSDSIALYAFLASIGTRGDTRAQPFTVPSTVTHLPPGDATRGRAVYARACANCHGAPRTGQGRLQAPRSNPASIVPNDTENEHNAAEGYDQQSLETVFVQKVRHGSFLGYAGVMPPFSREALADEALADVVAYLAPMLRPTRTP